jgi:hypothetical protein
MALYTTEVPKQFPLFCPVHHTMYTALDMLEPANNRPMAINHQTTQSHSWPKRNQHNLLRHSVLCSAYVVSVHYACMHTLTQTRDKRVVMVVSGERMENHDPHEHQN